MNIKLRLRSFLRYKTGKAETTVAIKEGSTVLEAARFFADENGEEIRNYIFDRKTGLCNVLFVVNKHQVSKEYVLKDDDELTILPPLAGG